MTTQLSLPIFKDEVAEQSFDTHLKCKRWVYTRRDEEGTFLNIGSLNFLGQFSGTAFRFHSKPFETNKSFKDIYVPELQNMSLSRIQEFANHIIENLELGKYAWNYEHRAYDFNSIVNADENMARNYSNHQATALMVEIHKLDRSLNGN